ncbi:phage tail protein [Exilibacterium tricleocarpae]|uniref:Phage tail protein n=1 Tax=Exilibacterium tricleocarpae TaxID=2591008 RepID=A0A545T5R0_9GAMM|nr:phage tail protein [Exilibacterium tricleocarpae]TQV72577.1 phage tail protein [Exilibacterium tricleocarpae]
MPAPFMLMLGPIRFAVDQGAYQKLTRNSAYTWASRPQPGHPLLKKKGLGGAARQYNGPGDDSLTISGTLYPQHNGGAWQLTLMRLSAGIGVPLPLITGTAVMGRWVIESIGDDRSEFLDNGAARKIEFTLSLKRYQRDYLQSLT